MITTLPGLYLFAVSGYASRTYCFKTSSVVKKHELEKGMFGALPKISFCHVCTQVATPFACTSISALRACNLLLGAGTVAVLFRLVRRRDPSPSRAAARALVLGLYPVHFFFAFLFCELENAYSSHTRLCFSHLSL